MLTEPKRGTTPPGEMDGACAALAWPIFMAEAFRIIGPESCLAMAILTAFLSGMC